MDFPGVGVATPSGGGAAPIPTLTINVSLVGGVRVFRIPEVDASTKIGAAVSFGGDPIFDAHGNFSIYSHVYIEGQDNPVLKGIDGADGITAVGVSIADGTATGTGVVQCIAPTYNAGASQLAPIPQSDNYEEPLMRLAFDVSSALPGAQLVANWGNGTNAVDVDGVLNVAGGWFVVPSGVVFVYPENVGVALYVATRKTGCTPSDAVVGGSIPATYPQYPTITFSDHGDGTVDATPSDLTFVVAVWDSTYVPPTIPLTAGVANISGATNVNACIVLRRGAVLLVGPTTGPTPVQSTTPTFSIPDTGEVGVCSLTSSGAALVSVNDGTAFTYSAPFNVNPGDAVKMRGIDGVIPQSSWTSPQTYSPMLATPSDGGGGAINVTGVLSATLSVQETISGVPTGSPYTLTGTNDTTANQTIFGAITYVDPLADGAILTAQKTNWTDSATANYPFGA